MADSDGTMVMCGQHGCHDPATYRVQWPGNPILACTQHKAELISLGRVMGHVVNAESLGHHHCTPDAAREALIELVAEQAHNAALWGPHQGEHAYHLQVALRALHEAVEAAT